MHFHRKTAAAALALAAALAAAAFSCPPKPRPTPADNEAAWQDYLRRTYFPAAAPELQLFDRTRVDLLTPTHAIEIDWIRSKSGSIKWRESFAQAQHYANVTGRPPAVILLARSPYEERADIHAALHAGRAMGIATWVLDTRTATWIAGPWIPPRAPP